MIDGAIPTCDIQLLELGAVLDGNSQMLGTRALNVIDCDVIGWGGRGRSVGHGLWVRGYPIVPHLHDRSMWARLVQSGNTLHNAATPLLPMWLPVGQ